MSALPSGNKLFLSMLQPDLPEFQKYADAIDQEVFNPEVIDFPQDGETLLSNFLKFEQNMFHEIGGYDNRVKNSGNQFIHNIDLDEKRCGVVATVNAFGRDTVPIHMNKMLQTCMRVLLDQPDFDLRFRSHPLPLTNESLARAKNMGGSIISLLFAIAFAVVPTGIAATLVKERESNVKHQQMISGASKLSYWLSTYTIDLIRGYFPITFGIIMIFAFNVDLPFVWVHFILFGLVIHPFTYATTFWFKKHGVAQLMTIIINIGLGALIPIAILILQTIESTQSVANTLRWIPRIFPIFSMINGIVQISIRNLIGQQKGDKDMPHPLDMSISGGDALFLGIGFFFWWGVTLLSEGGIFTKVFQSLK